MAPLSHTTEQQERRRRFVQVNVIHLPVTCKTSYHYHCTAMAGNITPLMFIQQYHQKEGRCAYSSVIKTIAALRERRGDLSETERGKLVPREYNPLMFTQQYNEQERRYAYRSIKTSVRVRQYNQNKSSVVRATHVSHKRTALRTLFFTGTRIIRTYESYAI